VPVPSMASWIERTTRSRSSGWMCSYHHAMSSGMSATA
jgi:hypothetical protein